MKWFKAQKYIGIDIQCIHKIRKIYSIYKITKITWFETLNVKIYH